MDIKTFLILGGYGNVGRVLTRLLLQETNVRLVLAGRNLEKAKAAADQFNNLFEGNRVTGMYADASDLENLRQVFKGVDFVVVASSTAKFTKEIATTALEAGCDYMDIHFGPKIYATLHSLAEAIKNAKRCFITGGGFHPGLPAATIRYAGQYFDSMEKAIVGSVMNVNFREYEISESTRIEFVEEVADFQPFFYKNGEWRKINMMSTKDYILMDFGNEFGKQKCAPMFFEELREIPVIFPTLNQTGFYMAGFNWFVDYFVFPFIFISLKLFPKVSIKPMSHLMQWSLSTFSKPPYGLVLKLEASGEQDGRAKHVEIQLSHKDGTYFTAIPVVACLLQYLDGSIEKPGLWLQANIVEPNRFMQDMKRMGIDVKVQEKSGNGR
ncbi:MAG: saccharopine dehydrogenase NADP-binding domain-containing protein [Candidatus Methanoperedens sp.]|nr:saccharopine dehydrogenase NADP-binding domain-containing protein [Candidatus Methanoperedens sp.]